MADKRAVAQGKRILGFYDSDTIMVPAEDSDEHDVHDGFKALEPSDPEYARWMQWMDDTGVRWRDISRFAGTIEDVEDGLRRGRELEASGQPLVLPPGAERRGTRPRRRCP